MGVWRAAPRRQRAPPTQVSGASGASVVGSAPGLVACQPLGVLCSSAVHACLPCTTVASAARRERRSVAPRALAMAAPIPGHRARCLDHPPLPTGAPAEWPVLHEGDGGREVHALHVALTRAGFYPSGELQPAPSFLTWLPSMQPLHLASSGKPVRCHYAPPHLAFRRVDMPPRRCRCCVGVTRAPDALPAWLQRTTSGGGALGTAP